MKATNQHATPRFLRAQAVADLIGVSTQTVWRWNRRRELTGFPEPAKKATRFSRVTAWLESDVLAWIKSTQATGVSHVNANSTSD